MKKNFFSLFEIVEQKRQSKVDFKTILPVMHFAIMHYCCVK